jgi:hypothetical protein
MTFFIELPVHCPMTPRLDYGYNDSVFVEAEEIDKDIILRIGQ